MVRLSGKRARTVPGIVREMFGLPTPVLRPVLNAMDESTRGRAWLGRRRWELDTWERQVESQRNNFHPRPVLQAFCRRDHIHNMSWGSTTRGKLKIRGDISPSPASRVEQGDSYSRNPDAKVRSPSFSDPSILEGH